MTTSVSSFIFSLFAGGIVVAAIATAVIFISKNDRVTRY